MWSCRSTLRPTFQGCVLLSLSKWLITDDYLSPSCWRQYAPLNPRSTLTRLHGAISQKAVIFKLASVTIRNIHPSDGATAQIGPWPPLLRFLNILFRHAVVGLLWTNDQPVATQDRTQDNTTQKHKDKTSLSRAEFEPTISVTKRPRPTTDHVATGTGNMEYNLRNKSTTKYKSERNELIIRVNPPALKRLRPTGMLLGMETKNVLTND
jgi:hypothetical protein